jgi:hypothetical protein
MMSAHCVVTCKCRSRVQVVTPLPDAPSMPLDLEVTPLPKSISGWRARLAPAGLIIPLAIRSVAMLNKVLADAIIDGMPSPHVLLAFNDLIYPATIDVPTARLPVATY